MLETAGRVSEEAKIEALESDQPSSPVTEASEPAQSEQKDLLAPELLAVLWKVVPVLWLLGAIAAGVVSGPPLLFLVLAGGALTLVVTLLWSSVQSLTGSSSLGFEEALSMGAPSKVEEEKRAVLRALKDLDYERGVGKISPEDYAELSAKYRAEAKRLMQSLDEALGPARNEVEKAIEARLQRAGIAAPEAAPAIPVEPAPAPTTPSPEKEAPESEEES